MWCDPSVEIKINEYDCLTVFSEIILISGWNYFLKKVINIRLGWYFYEQLFWQKSLATFFHTNRVVNLVLR